jgi:hypothetical protein
LQNYFHASRDIVRNRGRHANAQIYVEAIAQFQRDTPRDALTFLFFG